MNLEKQPGLPGGLVRPFPENSQEQTLNIDHLFDAFVGVDAEGRITAWNLQAEDTFGWSHADALGHPVSQLLIPARNLHLFHQTMRAVLRQEDSAQKLRTSITTLHRDGNEFEIEAICFPMSSEGGHVGIFARQAGRRKFTEVEAEERHHALMDQLGECYAEMDLRGRITFVNQAYCDVFGVSREDRAGRNYKTFFSADLAALFMETYSKVYRTGETGKVEYSLTLQNGKQVFNEQSVSLKRDAQGNLAGFMVIVRDCFERKQHEMELLRAKQAAEAANRAKGEFLANMSHEIRTPLNGVTGMLELIGYANPTPEQRKLLEMAQESAGSLLSVINDVLDFSKIEAGKLELDHVQFDLADIVSQASALIKVNALKKGLCLSYHLAPDVPRWLLGDPVRLKQVLLNLLGNAVKFTPSGQVAMQVHVERRNRGRVELKFSVADTGIGIPPEKHKIIFESFSQADTSTTRKFGGTGLGLTISSRIVECMGGNIRVESQAGKGSTFYFTVGLEVATGVQPHPPGPVVSIHEQAGTHKLKILLAEDNLLNQKLAARLLEKLGHQVVVAGTGIEALTRSQEQSFDLVLMDVQMPEMDGFAATAALRSREATTNTRTPIIAMTAHAMKGDRERCIEAGMDDYISKPVSADAIRQTIHRVMRTLT